jgi:hypothetical protein
MVNVPPSSLRMPPAMPMAEPETALLVTVNVPWFSMPPPPLPSPPVIVRFLRCSVAPEATCITCTPPKPPPLIVIPVETRPLIVSLWVVPVSLSSGRQPSRRAQITLGHRRLMRIECYQERYLADHPVLALSRTT